MLQEEHPESSKIWGAKEDERLKNVLTEDIIIISVCEEGALRCDEVLEKEGEGGGGK